ncbi:hypothetical protein NDU88_007185 [Pleurodeles waltl]|uniref:Uncharacterized protein n=1 Tax=Pleurodeles waltl TaxID=8319 RepID=A0AAV7NWN2_PLEWA|nr:hypothetical protein NDU88_007185 [Pleurodeles waltl]
MGKSPKAFTVLFISISEGKRASKAALCGPCSAAAQPQSPRKQARSWLRGARAPACWRFPWIHTHTFFITLKALMLAALGRTAQVCLMRTQFKIPQEVCSQIPLYHLIEDDLKQYSELTKLLLEVSQQFDESGLSLDLGKELESERRGPNQVVMVKGKLRSGRVRMEG